jgi:hypothetical protein
MEKIRNVVSVIGIFICVWVALTCMIYRLSSPTKTEMEVFIHIPYSFLLRMDK